MSGFSQRLQVTVGQRQVLTPGLVQMVTVLQLNRQELKEMIAQEMENNPVLEEAAEAGEEITPEELLPLLEAERMEPADKSILEATASDGTRSALDYSAEVLEASNEIPAGSAGADAVEITENSVEATPDPFDEIDFGSFFEDYLDPGYKSPASEQSEKPSFETFLSQPVTLRDHLRSQLSVSLMPEKTRDAAETIIGNLDDGGYLTEPLEDIAAMGQHELPDVEAGLKAVQSLDPAGVGARDMRECLLLQLESLNGGGGVAWQIIANHLRFLETRNYRELARVMGRPVEHIDIALRVIRHLDPRPGLKFMGGDARAVEPDVFFIKDGDDFRIQVDEDELPQLRLNGQYRHMLQRDTGSTKETRDYIRDRYNSALQLIKNIEQRRQTILRVCDAVKRRQMMFLSQGIDHLRPMMIKEIAEEVGVHPSTVSRAVANKYAHTPHGVFELRYFFSESTQGPGGVDLPLLLLKRKVKAMIEKEDRHRPLTDEQITAHLQAEGIQVTRRTVAKYREDLKIPSSHERRQRD